MEKNKCTLKDLFNLPRLAQCIDDQMRFGDLKLNRTTGSLLDIKWGLSRHSYHYLLLPALITGIMVMGLPELGWRCNLAVFTSASVFGLLILVGRLAIRGNWSLRNEMAIQTILVLMLGAVLWVLGDEVYRDGILFYRHFYLLAAGVVGAALLLCWLLTELVWTRWKIANNYDRALKKTELFASRDKQIPLGWKRFVRAFATVIQGAPLQLLLLPSVVAILSRPDWLFEFTAITLGGSYLALAMGGLDARLNQMWRLYRSAFFQGGTRLVSLIIIALAVARIVGVSYVTTVFDTAEGVVIFLMLFSAYVLFWWYDYWVNRLVAQELLKLLRPGAGHAARIDYPIAPGSVATSVPAEGRSLQIHGADRFIVLARPENNAFTYFQAYSSAKLFQTLSLSGFPGGKAVPSKRQIERRIFDFKSLAATILVVMAATVTLLISNGIQKPQLVVEDRKGAGIEVAGLLDHHHRTGTRQPALVVAASGGGTRAALYTAAVLEGLYRRERLQHVIMGSGVSGGGAALAYFAGKRAALTRPDSSGWERYFETMSMPFIRDVINSAMEWRTVSKSRLGGLLSESFMRRWQLADTADQLGEITDFGLILNTSIAGRFVCNSTASECLDLPLIEAERRYRKTMTQNDLAGGRLILTNLQLDSAFAPPVVEVGGPGGLPVVVDHPKTRLEVAAALNANFPPVFSNAAVDLFDKERYWVTDGGAVDNRGIEMSLYALRQILEVRHANRSGNSAPLPAITMVAIDASGYSNTYSQDRGAGSLVSGGTQCASLLMVELLDSIRARYDEQGNPGGFQFIYLPMPLCLRESGSFGTHWMLQPTIEVKLGNGDRRSLPGTEMVKLLRVMHTPQQKGKLSADARDVLAFSIKDKRWRKGALALGFIAP